jgi:S-adenosyl methyltransferase
MTSEPSSGLDVTKPNIARVYDYLLGGKDNYAADREEAERLLRVYPPLPRLALENRLFLRRAVTWLAQQGIRQFLDIGSGLPTVSNTHKVAQEVDPSCRIVYADNDRVVVTHARALLAGTGVAAIEADLAQPTRLLADPAVDELVRPTEPTALVLAMVLHFFPAEMAQKIVAELAAWLAPGSYVVISVGSGDEETARSISMWSPFARMSPSARLRLAKLRGHDALVADPGCFGGGEPDDRRAHDLRV